GDNGALDISHGARGVPTTAACRAAAAGSVAGYRAVGNVQCAGIVNAPAETSALPRALTGTAYRRVTGQRAINDRGGADVENAPANPISPIRCCGKAAGNRVTREGA